MTMSPRRDWPARSSSWQMQHVRDYGEPATASVLEDEFPTSASSSRRRPSGTSSSGCAPATSRTRAVATSRRSPSLRSSRAAGRRQGDAAPGPRTDRPHGHARRGLRHRRLPASPDEYDKAVLRGKGPSLGYAELDEHFHGQVGVTFLIAAPKTYKSWTTSTPSSPTSSRSASPTCTRWSFRRWRATGAASAWPPTSLLEVPQACLMPDELKPADQGRGWLLDDVGETLLHRQAQPGLALGRPACREGAGLRGRLHLHRPASVHREPQGHGHRAIGSTSDYFEVVNDLRNYSDHIPIFVVHQFNRSVMKADEMPEMQQAKGSSAIEEVATLGLGLWANKDMRATPTSWN
jgi:hypothetical protein